ncbi:ABC transporter ATP-binding protein [Telmatospirillum siberiense]|uniref:ABC transporter n=1 Tax=Telmatospirillum siberiense TaxID=382514 RepID=A0A2N3PYX6_9PROT|nr:ABC transporter ATP-binding protein [Telmatospirillum siberiense]PKU25598.1 ABC transporter [Telmatospirillum siberiense]
MGLEVDGLAIGYGRTVVGRDLSFTLAARQVMCLLGPNGSGKSTLFKTILGLLPALEGEVRLDGERVRDWSRRRFAKAIAYVPQSHRSFFSFTALDLVIMGRTAHIGAFAMPSGEDHDVAHASLARLGMDHLATRSFPELSGGEQQMVLVARALAQEARILILDEPTASLDFGNRVKLLREIRRLADGGLGVILSTHDPDHALQIADQVLLLHQGRALAAGSPAETVTAETLRQVYGVDVAILDAGAGRRVCVSSIQS